MTEVVAWGQLSGDTPALLLAADALAAVAFLTVAATAERRALAVTALLTALAWTAGGLASGLALVHRPLMAHAALGFPDGRLRTRRAVVAVGFLWVIALFAPLGRAPAVAVVGAALVVGASGGGWATARRARRIARGAAMCTAVAMGGAAIARAVQPSGGAAVHIAVAYAVLVAAAGVLLAAGLITGAGGASDTTDTIVELADLRGVDIDELLGAGTTRGARRDVDGDAIARAADVARALVTEHAARQRDLREQVDRVRRARRRVVEVADVERRRLDALLTEATDGRLTELDGLLRDLTAAGIDDQVTRLLTETSSLRTEIDRLGRGLHPRLLERGGLRAGLDELGRSTALRTVVSAPDRRFSLSVETTMWYVCCEAVANAGKHAAATTIRIVLEVEGDDLVATVSDDGTGGARPVPGGGLVGLSDRLAAGGGSLHVADGATGGTVLRARLPAEASA